jgi:hypothetical protein
MFPDSEWVKDQRAWLLKEKPNADLIRQLARDFDKEKDKDEDMRAKEALVEEVVGSMDPSQVAALNKNGEVSVSLSSLEEGAHALFVQYGNIFLEAVNRSGDSAGLFADLSRTGDTGVDIFKMGNGKLKFEFFGKNRQGTKVVW